VEDGDEGSGGLLVASGDTSEMLNLEEEAFDEIALAIEGVVALDLR
jgi:hypothetical protein